MLGSGILAMPAVFDSVGYGLGVLLIVVAMAFSMLGQYLLFLAAAASAPNITTEGEEEEEEEHQGDGDEEVSNKTSVSKLCQRINPMISIVFDSAIMLKSLGVSLSYLMVIGDLMVGISSAQQHRKWLNFRSLWITLSLLIIIPLTLHKNIDSLKKTSFVGVLIALYLVGLSAYYFFATKNNDEDEVEYHLFVFNGSKTILNAFCVFIFGFTCHQNVLPVYNEFPNMAREHMRQIVIIGTSSTATMYVLFSLFSYLTLGAECQSNIFENYNHTPATNLARALFCLLAAFTIPLQMHPFKRSLLGIMKLTGSKRPLDLNQSQLELLASLMAIFAVYLTAINVRDLKKVLSVIGRCTGIPICYFLPALLYFYIPLIPKTKALSLASLLMAGLGVCIILASVIS